MLFHVTANPAWSNLPLSGLFVEMLRRVSTVASLGGSSRASLRCDRHAQPGRRPGAQSVLAPVQVLDGFGQLIPPPPTASPIPAVKDFPETRPQLVHPPGYYGPAGKPQALNVVAPTKWS